MLVKASVKSGNVDLHVGVGHALLTESLNGFGAQLAAQVRKSRDLARPADGARRGGHEAASGSPAPPTHLGRSRKRPVFRGQWPTPDTRWLRSPGVQAGLRMALEG